MCKWGSGQVTTWCLQKRIQRGSWPWPGALLPEAGPAQALQASFCYRALGSLKKVACPNFSKHKIGQWDLPFLDSLGLWWGLISIFKVLWVWFGLFIFSGWKPVRQLQVLTVKVWCMLLEMHCVKWMDVAPKKPHSQAHTSTPQSEGGGIKASEN